MAEPLKSAGGAEPTPGRPKSAQPPRGAMEAQPTSGGALSHIRVLDLTRVLAGPWATQNLADMGAEVIKIERPKAGDDTRHWGPPWVKDVNGGDTRDAAYYACANRGKQSVTLDIAKPAGQALVRELAKGCDVFIENYKVGDLKRYGLDYDSLKALNPRLVYCSITGFGQSGPSSHKPGYDFIFQGLGGLMSITGERDERPGGGPQKVGVAVADILTGMYATSAILAALTHRAESGVGQYIDIALLDCIVAFGSYQAVSYLVSGKVPKSFGNASPTLIPYDVFRTRDGHIIVGVGNEGQWLRLCKVIGRDDLAAREDLRTMTGRLAARDEVTTEVARSLLDRTSADWLERLEAEGVACGPINNYQQVFEDAQVQHRGLRVEVPRADGAMTPTLASPLRLTGTPVQYGGLPTLGEHTDAVLTRLLGKSPDDIEQLRRDNVV